MKLILFLYLFMFMFSLTYNIGFSIWSCLIRAILFSLLSMKIIYIIKKELK